MSMLDGAGPGMANDADREADGFLQGLAVGVVTDNRDPDGMARVRVRLPWHADSDTSFWARLAVPMAGGGRGSYFLPEIDDEVLVGAECGDPSHLYVLGGLWSGRSGPPEGNGDGANNRRLIHSRSGHRLVFDDSDSAPQVELTLADGKHLVLDRDGITLEDGTGNRIVIASGSSAITIESTASLKLKSQSISIEAGASLELKAAGTLTIQGALVQIN